MISKYICEYKKCNTVMKCRKMCPGKEYPLQYYCPKCGAFFTVGNQGLCQYFDPDGKPSSPDCVRVESK